jgi:hypothetical protein
MTPFSQFYKCHMSQVQSVSCHCHSHMSHLQRVSHMCVVLIDELTELPQCPAVGDILLSQLQPGGHMQVIDACSEVTLCRVFW